MIHLGIVTPGSTIRIPWGSYALSTGASAAASNFAVGDILIYKDGSTTERASTTGFTANTTFDSLTGINGIAIDLSSNATAGFFAAGSNYEVVVGPVTVDSQTVYFPIATFTIGYQGAVINTTLATVSNQTSMTLTSGPAENDALVGMWAIIHDVASAVQLSRVLITAYTGSTKTITLAAGATFTVAATDNISIMGPAPLQPATAGRTLVVDSAGLADANTVKVGPTGSGTAQTARDLGASVLLSSGTGTGQLDFTSGIVKANVTQFGGTNATASGGRPEVNTSHIAGTSQTARDLGASVLLSNGTGTGQISLSSGAVTAGTVSDKTGYSLTATTGLGNQTANITGNLSGSVGSVTGNVGGNVTGSVGSLATQAKADVNAEVDTALADYDPPTRAELTSDTNSILAKLAYVVLTNGTIGATGNDTTHVHLAGLTYGDDEINGYMLVLNDVSTGELHWRKITDWVLSTELATVDALPFTPQNSTDTFAILASLADASVTGGDATAANQSTIIALLGTPAGASVSVDVAAVKSQTAAIETDTQDIQSRLPAALTGGGNIKTDVLAISGDTTAADNAEAFFDGTGYAGTGNVIPTVTTLTNAPSDSSGVTTLLSRIPSGIFTGITSLAQWLGLIAGKHSGNSTARTEIRATGAGSGTFDETTDSLEAVRDNTGTAGAGLSNIGTIATVTTLTNAPSDSSGTTTLLSRLSSARAGYLDNINNAALATTSAQTGDSFARLGAPAGASVSADVAAVKAQTAAIEVDTQDLQTQIGTAGAGLTAADDAVIAAIAALNNLASGAAMTLTSGERNAIADAMFARSLGSESYAADGAVPTFAQALFMLISSMFEVSISGTTMTLKKLDGSTTAMTLTLDDDTTPTSKTRAT